MILSTCNRVEVYAPGRGGAPLDAMAAFLARAHGREPAEIALASLPPEGEAAVRHAFRVAASLDSMVIGEPQILGQVKSAYQIAEKAGTLGPVLNALRNRSLAAAKRVRTETGIGRNAVSVSHVAVELARKIFGDLRDRHVLLVGAGKMSELAARHLVRDGARATVLGGRTFARAEQLAAALGGRAVPFEALRDELARADIVISGTGRAGASSSTARTSKRRGARGAAGRSSSSTSRCRATSTRGARARRRLPLRPRRPADGGRGQPARAAEGGRRGRGARRARGARVPGLAALARRGAAARRAAPARRGDPPGGDREGAPRLGPLTPEQEHALEAATPPS